MLKDVAAQHDADARFVERAYLTATGSTRSSVATTSTC
jgi:hypothetical protein